MKEGELWGWGWGDVSKVLLSLWTIMWDWGEEDRKGIYFIESYCEHIKHSHPN